MHRLLAWLGMAVAAFLVVGHPATAQSRIVCTIFMDQDRRTVIEEGDCDARMSPASTFKVPISLMGYDAGILVSPLEPVLPFREGYVDWRPQWRGDQTPADWMRESVVWYSRQVTARLGMERFAAYVDAFAYGNRDLSGRPGDGDGLASAWLSSSLAISPREQAVFLSRLAAGDLPVTDAAMRNTAAIMDYGPRPGGWRVFGKTGAGFTRDAAGEQVRGRPFGWFVGWAERDGGTLAFARLIQDEERHSSPPGFRARDGLLDTYFGADRHFD